VNARLAVSFGNLMGTDFASIGRSQLWPSEQATKKVRQGEKEIYHQLTAISERLANFFLEIRSLH
jgi:hypothetical protein